LIAALGVGGATYVGVRAEADELFDYQLRQMALSLRDQGRIADDERAALDDPDLDFIVQIWSLDGVRLYARSPRDLNQPLPPRAVLGFADVRVGGQSWRVYGAATPQRVVQVAQPLSVRRRLAAQAAWGSILPIAIAVPVAALGLWWIVGWSLRPLQRAAGAARERQAGASGSGGPLPSAGLPDEIRPLVEAFNGLLGRLDQAFETQRGFVADAAHELRTPLTALKLQLSVLAGAQDDAEREASIARLRSGVDRATRLVEQLLSLARAEPGVEPPHEMLDLAEIVRLAVADASALAGARQVDLRLEADAPCPLRGDAAALRSLARNLIDNAVVHGRPGGQVVVRLRGGHGTAAADGGNGPAQQAGGPVLQVDDDGPGIPPAERERAFDRFHRGEAPRGEGSGLGLAIVQAVARRHGATVRLTDAPRGGLRAEVVWPATAGSLTAKT
jgi:two-component system OmpR family sensor kinase/two-component system sensor histidine kinase QseC